MANAYKGYQEKELQEWKRTRLIGYYSIAPWNKEIKSPKDLFRLEGDYDNLKGQKPAKVIWHDR